MFRLCALLILAAPPVFAESLVATRVIRAQTLLSSGDVTLVVAEIPGALKAASDALGLEAKVTLYPGRPVRAVDIGPPAVVERNQIITLVYRVGGLGITTEGRALSRGGLGEIIPAMNLSSRTVLAGRVVEGGYIYVGATP